ncbi:hypothetical protein [Arachidicoccus terrestris]|uniref:hypothetical protein n=1 Tax=Arachidicoccus terrestris TaxID=2875539 RepID=UPI001CC524A1|nr:hypothetical protein [Arachidicoccus terrestris]UAY55269.1 hypothetical protein K9M52_17960 [Arachidicoccus terrestris]
MVSIFNPFQKIAGTRALNMGIVITFLTLLISFYSHSVFNGVIDFHVFPFSTIWPYAFYYVIAWLCLVIYFGLAGLIFTKTRFRWIDIAGTTLLSRFPLLLIAIAAFAIPYIDTAALSNLSKIHFTAGFYIASTFSLLCIIWTIALYYNSYRICLNIKGQKAIWSFIAVMIMAEATSLFIIHCIHLK